MSRRMGYFGDAWAVTQDAADELLHEIVANEWEPDDYGVVPRFGDEMLSELNIAHNKIRFASRYALYVEELFDGVIDEERFLQHMESLKLLDNIEHKRKKG